MAGVCVFDIIISKLGHYLEPGLIVLLEIDKDLEERFYYTILLLKLTVSLRVEQNKKFPFDVDKVAEQ